MTNPTIVGFNILVLDEDPHLAGEYHSDRDVSRKLLEYVELMKMAHTFLDGAEVAVARLGLRLDSRNRQAINGMAATWVREASDNYHWLYMLTMELCAQSRKRFGRPSVLEPEAETLIQLPLNIPMGTRTRFTVSVPPQYRRSSPVAAYRAFYCAAHRAWTGPIPRWFEATCGQL